MLFMLQVRTWALNINKPQKAGIKSSTLRELIITTLKLQFYKANHKEQNGFSKSCLLFGINSHG